jgi:cell division protein FtsN
MSKLEILALSVLLAFVGLLMFSFHKAAHNIEKRERATYIDSIKVN